MSLLGFRAKTHPQQGPKVALGVRVDFPEPVMLRGTRCRHCGEYLSAVGEWDFGFPPIKGGRALIYVHTGTFEQNCTVTYEATPWDGHQANDAYDDAITARAESGGSGLLKIVCDGCGNELVERGALVFSPPAGRDVEKFHICGSCWSNHFVTSSRLDDSWSIEHPLNCRLSKRPLHECTEHRAFARWATEHVLDDGRFLLDGFDDDGTPRLFPVGAISRDEARNQ